MACTSLLPQEVGDRATEVGMWPSCTWWPRTARRQESVLVACNGLLPQEVGDGGGSVAELHVVASDGLASRVF